METLLHIIEKCKEDNMQELCVIISIDNKIDMK